MSSSMASTQARDSLLQMSNSMNGYHIGHHLRNNSASRSTTSTGTLSMPHCPMELPEVKPSLEVKPVPEVKPLPGVEPLPEVKLLSATTFSNSGSAASSVANSNNQTNVHKKDEDIASSYFQSKFGHEQKTKQVVVKKAQQEEQSSKQMPKMQHRSASVGYNQHAARSNTQTPEREVRASSIAPNNGGSRRTSFSYLSLLPKDGSFPHRTQPIGDGISSRRNSKTHGSNENLAQFSKPALMIRSNPIGLAEPSVKRDGYAVGKDGSYYINSEHVFENRVTNGRSVSATPDRDLQYKQRDSRRASTSSVSSGTGIRVGGGLIETGRPVTQSFLPFGPTTGPVKPNYVIRKGTRSRSQSQSRRSQP